MATLNPTKGVPPLIVARMDPDRDPNRCAWFLQCNDPAVAEVQHPTIARPVPTCQRHLAWLQEG